MKNIHKSSVNDQQNHTLRSQVGMFIFVKGFKK